jgi:multiple sugar transport system permease protein
VAVTATAETAGRQRRDRVARRGTQQTLRYLAAIALAFFFIFPFLVVLSTSFKPGTEVFTFPPHLWSHHWTTANYGEAFHAMPFWRYFLNTTFLAVVSVIGQLIASPLVAYSLAKIRWRGRNAMLLLILATMMLPPQATLIPLYVLWNKIGLTGYWPLLLPQFFGYAFFIFMLRQFFMGIPDELLDAARVDGSSEFRIYRTIALPLARAALVTVAIFQFMWTWTDFLLPLIYINDPKRYTLSIGLYNFFSSHGVEWGALMAASTLMSLPLVVLFVFAQRQFVEGVTLTGIR